MAMQTKRDFHLRPILEQDWLVQNTWCDNCQEADLGLSDPREYEVDGTVFVEGKCKRCNQVVKSTVIEKNIGRAG